jgi:hypothetical protein
MASARAVAPNRHESPRCAESALSRAARAGGATTRRAEIRPLRPAPDRWPASCYVGQSDPVPSRSPFPRARPLLVVAPATADRGELFAGLEARGDFRVLYAATVDEALQALRERPVALLIAAPELPAAAVSELLASREEVRPALPVLVIRHRQSEEPPGWERGGVGILRRPLLPDALSRSIDVVLGLAARRA